MNIVMVQPQRLIPHPYNRQFPEEGPEWESFAESIGFRGVRVPILARKMGHDYQIVGGHRRTRAAIVKGLKEVPVQLEEMGDDEAMELVFIDNLLAVGLDPVDEAMGVKGLLEVGYTPRKVAERCCKDERWVRTRQGLLELGEVALAAMRKPKDDAGHLGVRTAEEVLKVEEPALREQALQAVLFPEFQVGVLNAEQAREVITERILKPHAERLWWESNRTAVTKSWKERLRKLLPVGVKKDLLLQWVGWEDCERQARGGVPAERPVSMEESSADAPQFMAWVHLAVRHGQAVRIVWDPQGGQDKSLALVDKRVLVEAEEAGAAMREMDAEGRKLAERVAVNPEFVPWLVTRARGTVSQVPSKEVPSAKVESMQCPACEDEVERLEKVPGKEVYLCGGCLAKLKEDAAAVAKEVEGSNRGGGESAEDGAEKGLTGGRQEEEEEKESNRGGAEVAEDGAEAAELDEDDPLWCVNEQVKGLLEGEGATEDHEAVLALLRGTGLPEGTVKRMHRAIVCGEKRELVCTDVVRMMGGLVIDGAPVRRLQGWVESGSDDAKREEWFPEWAKDLEPQHVGDVVAWVMGLELGKDEVPSEQ